MHHDLHDLTDDPWHDPLDHHADPLEDGDLHAEPHHPEEDHDHHEPLDHQDRHDSHHGGLQDSEEDHDHSHYTPWEPLYLGHQHEHHHIMLAGLESGGSPVQQEPADCAITAEIGILKALGHDISESDARDLAQSEGWLTEHGTAPEHIGRLLETHGIEVDSGYDRSLTDLLDALKNGQKVLVGLDAEEIWHPIRGAGGAPLELPNHPHVVSVTGCTVDDAGRTCLEINDPADPDGAGHRVEASDFLNAWADFGNFAVITRL